MYIDLLNVPEEKKSIQSYIWKDLILQLDRDMLLTGSREHLIELYHNKYEIAKKQYLAGLDENSESFNKELNSAIRRWKNNKEETACCLSDYIKKNNKSIFVIVDNTDQFLSDMQDYCFSIAQDISSRISCTCVISMREERFYFSKIRGVLDAFHNFGFHLTSPPTQNVFFRRFVFVISVLKNNPETLGIFDIDLRNDLIKFLHIFLNAFKNKNSPFYQFMTACSHGNIRFSLEIFRQYVESGYLAVDEWLGGRWYLDNSKSSSH